MPSTISSDVIVVGAGSAGCIVASRLSERSNLNVLLIEAGADIAPDNPPADIADVFPRAYANPAYFWPDIPLSLSGQAATFSQPRVLGGGSAVMGMWSLRGLPDDFDEWARGGARGWSYADVLPYFKRFEYDCDFPGGEHGDAGPIRISRLRPELLSRFSLAAAKAAERQGLPPRNDINATSATDGVFSIPIAADGDRRADVGSAYLSRAVRSRRNLRILTSTEVTQLTLEGNRVCGVAVRGDASTPAKLSAPRVVLCCGAIHSPRILLQSGIGDPRALIEAGVVPTHHLSAVGQGLQNHSVVHVGSFLRAEARQQQHVRRYANSCIRLSSGVDGGAPSDLLISVLTRATPRRSGTHLGMLGVHLYAPLGRGHVKLQAPGSASPVCVRMAHMDHPVDRQRMIIAAQKACSILQDPEMSSLCDAAFLLPRKLPIRQLNAPGLKAFLLSQGVAAMDLLPAPVRKRILPLAIRGSRRVAGISDPREFEAAVLSRAAPMFHPTGTCAIGSVVDPETRVIGIDGLYVADASIMPTIPRGNTNLPTMMIGEKAAATMLRLWG